MKENNLEELFNEEVTLQTNEQEYKTDLINSKLFEAIRQGDEKAFSKYYLGFTDPLVRFLTQLTGNEDDAKEITQDVFAMLWENHAQIQPQRSLDSFVYTSAKHMAYKVLRHRKTHSRYSSEIESTYHDTDIPADELVITHEVSEMFKRTLANMPAQRRKVFELSRFKGMTYEQIAAEMQLSQTTVKKHMQLALKDMRKALTTFLVLLLT